MNIYGDWSDIILYQFKLQSFGTAPLFQLFFFYGSIGGQTIGTRGGYQISVLSQLWFKVLNPSVLVPEIGLIYKHGKIRLGSQINFRISWLPVELEAD